MEKGSVKTMKIIALRMVPESTQLPNGREWYEIYNPRDVTLGVRRV